MSVLFVTTHLPPDYQFGGVVESGSQIYKYLREMSNHVFVSSVSRDPASVDSHFKDKNVKCYKSVLLHKWGFSLESITGLFRDISVSDVIWVNGAFSFHNSLALFLSVLLNKKMIFSLRGGFLDQRLKQKQYKKSFYLFFVVPLIKHAAIVHITGDVEYDGAANLLGFPDDQIINIPNGVSEKILDLDVENGSEISRKTLGIGKTSFVFLFLGRTDREKGIDILIEAYRQFCVFVKKEDAVLVIVGPDHQSYLKSFDLDYEKENIIYIDGLYNFDKFKMIKLSDTLILPSYSENFGNVVSEAMIFSKPVITTEGTPWSILREKNIGYCIPANVKSLLSSMQSVYAMSKKERKLMGEGASTFILENFTWKIQVKKMFDLLEKVLSKKLS